jgi:peptidoglycan/LPS O-acetylase OafA/YrhL
MLMMPFAYAWCAWGAGDRGFEPVVQLGRTSLMVYWAHIIFVYGSFSLMRKEQQGIPMATLGIVVITAAMLMLSLTTEAWEKAWPARRDRWRKKLTSGNGATGDDARTMA